MSEVDEIFDRLPTLEQIKAAAKAFREAATALELAIGVARQIYQEGWPIATGLAHRN